MSLTKVMIDANKEKDNENRRFASNIFNGCINMAKKGSDDGILRNMAYNGYTEFSCTGYYKICNKKCKLLSDLMDEHKPEITNNKKTIKFNNENRVVYNTSTCELIIEWDSP